MSNSHVIKNRLSKEFDYRFGYTEKESWKGRAIRDATVETKKLIKCKITEIELCID